MCRFDLAASLRDCRARKADLAATLQGMRSVPVPAHCSFAIWGLRAPPPQRQSLASGPDLVSAPTAAASTRYPQAPQRPFGVDPDWPDELDPRTGTFVYHGDQKTPGRALHDTPRKGNVLLRDMFDDADGGVEGRSLVPPVSYSRRRTGSKRCFKGLLVPGGAAIRPDDRLVAIWKSTQGQRYQNSGDVHGPGRRTVPRAWLSDIRAGEATVGMLPGHWRRWVATGTPTTDRCSHAGVPIPRGTVPTDHS